MHQCQKKPGIQAKSPSIEVKETYIYKYIKLAYPHAP
jgi:hypothetical protein